MNKTIVTHPANLDLLKRQLDSGEYDDGQGFQYFTVRTDPHMEQDKPTGKFWLLVSANVSFPVERQDVRIETRFISYGPEDVPFLLFAGMIREDREALFYVLDDSFRFRLSALPFVTPPRFISYLDHS